MFIDFRGRGREGQREISMWEKNINHLPPIRAPRGDCTRNLNMCPDPELNLQTFSVREDAPNNWATWTEHFPLLNMGEIIPIA